jgi:UDP-N-acetylmuramyl pentapeptide phosphotransferase/UDP-N-acetylglucosamine-1-phosphate transferase
MRAPGLLDLLLTAAAAALLCAVLIVASFPLLKRYALARPNARSSHRVPTPQGAGLAVIIAAALAGGGAIALHSLMQPALGLLLIATGLITLVGAIDDLRSMSVLPRLALQTVAVAIVLAALPAELRVLPILPFAVERVLLLVGWLWLINLVNFMDGIDWMTVAEAVPVTAALVLLGVLGRLPLDVAFVAAALCGAFLGFAPFNRPVARVFLGDVGSLPFGLLLGWCLLALAGRSGIAAALLLPLYYLCDATLTLLRRLAKREKVWVAHRSHFYQRATDSGFSVPRIVSNVFVLNVALATLAIISATTASYAVHAATLAVGAALVALTLFRFSRPAG